MPSHAGYLLVALAALATAAAAVMLPSDRSEAERPALLLTAKKGSDLGLATSAKGRPIVTASALVPGKTATGQIKVRNTGTKTLTLRLATRNLSDQPGPNGGKLSEALQVQVIEVPRKRKGNKPRPAYAGRVTSMAKVRLKKLEPDAKRIYQFSVKMLDGGTPASATEGDNAYQGSEASVDFVWRALVRK